MYGNPEHVGFGDPSSLTGIEGTPEGFGSPQLTMLVRSGLLETEETGGQVVIESSADWPDGPVRVFAQPTDTQAVIVQRDEAFQNRLLVYLPPLAPGRYTLKIVTKKGSAVLSNILFVLPDREHPQVLMLRGFFPAPVYLRMN